MIEMAEVIMLSTEDTKKAGYPCSDSSGDVLDDVADVEVITDGE